MAALMPVAEALARVLDGATPLPAEAAPLADAHGRVLAADLAAQRTQPPDDVSAMDGYAVRADDVATCPAKLKVIGEVAAGHPFDGQVGPGEAARIFTGGVLPPGADTIVIQENTTPRRRHRDGDRRQRPQGPPHPRRRARFQAGRRVLLAKGRRLTDRDLALAAAMNHPTVPVHRRPKVAVLATGDELVMPGTEPGFGEIVYSNGYATMALARGEGCDGHRPRHRARPPRRDRRRRPPRPRRRRRHPGDLGRRLGRRLRPRAEGAGGRRARAVVLEGRAAAGPADDARAARRHARARPARQSGLGLCLRGAVPRPADPAARRTRATSSRESNRPCSAATCRRTTSARTICAPP